MEGNLNKVMGFSNTLRGDMNGAFGSMNSIVGR